MTPFHSTSAPVETWVSVINLMDVVHGQAGAIWKYGSGPHDGEQHGSHRVRAYNTQNIMAKIWESYRIKKWPFMLVMAVLGLAITALMHLAALNDMWPGVRRGYYVEYKVGNIIIWAREKSGESHGYYDSHGEWIINGQHRLWSRAGVLIHDSQWRDGLLTGTMTVWNSDGTLMESVEFMDDHASPSANSEQYEAHGVPANGTITFYNHGKRLRRETYAGGQLKERVVYEKR